MSETDIHEAAAALGRRGGQARARNLSPERVREIASIASNARWAKVRAQVAESRKAQGLPERVEDPHLLGDLAREAVERGGDAA